MKEKTTIVLSWEEVRALLEPHLRKCFKDGSFTGPYKYSVGYDSGVDKQTPLKVIIESEQELPLFEAPPVAPPIATPSETAKHQKNWDICTTLVSPIDTPELDFSVKTLNLLTTMGLVYVWQLVAISEDALLDYKGFGQKSLEDVRRCLAVKGIFPDHAYRLRTLLISDLEVPFNLDLKTDLTVMSAYSHDEDFQAKVQALLASKIGKITLL